MIRILVSLTENVSSSLAMSGADILVDEGYVQGMSDLCAPLYVVMDAEEELTFWCFVEVMNRMVPLLAVECFND